MSFPNLCLSIYGTTEEICNILQNYNADLFEIRLDLSPEPDGTRIRSATRKPLIFTAHRQPNLLEKYESFADYVDVEQEKSTGQNRIVSIHSGEQDPQVLWNQLSGEHLTKIVLETESYETIAQLILLNRKHKPRSICFASGEVGAFSRILAVLYGAPWIYTSLPDRPTAPGQFTFDQLTNIYRLKRFETGNDISVFGIVGNPVSHSRSPEIQNRWFAEESLQWIYLLYPCTNLRYLFDNARFWGAKGFSITYPYKEEVLSLLDSVSPEAKQLRSCNTVGYVEGKWIGTNTDLQGIVALLQDVPISGRVAILGAGASARAFASLIRPRVSDLLILNRTLSKAESLAAEFQGRAGSWNDLKGFDYDVLIQATPIGWHNEELPVVQDSLRPGKIVIDSIYKDTPLLNHARRLGCRTINGEKWFEAQAEAQFQWWKKLLKVNNAETQRRRGKS